MDGEYSTSNPANLSASGIPRRTGFTAVATLFLATLGFSAAIFSGCAHRYGHIVANDDKDLVGSHEAGAATWNPLVDSSVAQLLSRCPPPPEPVPFGSPFANGSTPPAMMASHHANGEIQLNDPNMLGVPGALDPNCPPQLATGPARVCFIGIENKSAEELVDFKDQLYERIDSQINAGEAFRSISRRMVDAALIETRLRPDSLFLPANRAAFAAALGRQGTPVDYLLYATITTGTTERNKSTQRDYVLTLEMVNLHSGDYIKESAKIRKGYHKTRAGKWWNFGIFDQADG
ncbi:penicillin-binding protein activator LpoB [Aporhodopirellula aestuarii]|uniref:Penicillin-binding protein activator LpoB n=1 Tax=Aporhodopirellula aestuarii TaxID=2950107 RepID=A0ABT0U6H7_9BACT|nr:penicillin-binding protein activator LpoB [Aporhodopirellula aestuarii]MCM2372495.1 penicillin-binding protein activator LpoB [Aporhodopirellula aestuarii]